MNVTLFGGPWDGLKMELPESIDKLAMVDDRGQIHRYETESDWTVIKGDAVESGADMRLADNPAEFDLELRQAMGSVWKDAI